MINVSCLFTPATKLHALKSGAIEATKVVVIDLEDAIHMKDKERARAILLNFDYSFFHDRAIRLGLRINQLDSIEGIKDLTFLHELKARGFPFAYIIVTKVNNREEMAVYRSLLDGFADRIGIVPIIETQDGVKNVESIAAMSAALILGQADLSATMYAPNRSYLSHARAMICLAAAKYDIMAIHGNSFELNDLAQLTKECVAARNEGFTGKAAIHPWQLGPINATFGMSDGEIAQCAKLVDMHSRANDGFSIENEIVVAPPFVKKAQRMIALSKRINQG
jgi:citrate lyase beta subunit